MIVEALRNGNGIFIFGNGGSASDAQHFAAELTGRFEVSSRKALNCVCLNTDTSALTAIANDYGYDEVFRRQLMGLARPGDVAFGISTSGNSRNVEVALGVEGLKTISLTGNSGGVISGISDININVGFENTARIQEAHIFILHFICSIIDRDLS